MNYIKNNKGYTLIELIVSISIIATISTIMFANYRRGGFTDELNIASQSLVSEIRKAQGYALSYKEFNGDIQDQGGWGIRLTNIPSSASGNFILFFDFNNSGKYDDGEEILDKPIGKNIRVSGLKFGASSLSNYYFWAIYYPPDPTIMLRADNNATDINGNSSDFDYGYVDPGADEVEIILSHTNGASKSIFLNRFGLIDID